MAIYTIYNGASPTTAKFVAVTTGVTIKTLLQVKPSATKTAKIIEWGFKCDAPASAALAVIELLQTDVAATVTASALADIVKVDADALAGGDQTTNLIQIGTTSTGYTSSGEGTITAVRLFDHLLMTIPSSNGYEFVKQWPLGREPVIEIAKFGRIRTHFSVAVNAVCYMTVEV
jgi:hypothetical protein